MNLEKLFKAQQILRDKINYNEPDRFEKLILALLVEIGECANCWRGFKFWSKDQEPRTKVQLFNNDDGTAPDWNTKNPLLEEYVDGLHFVLELGIELDYVDKATIWRIPETDGTEGFSSVFRSIVMLEIHRGIMEYQRLVSVYYRLGITLGFTVEQIEQAYYDKNQINHERQNNGY